MKYKWLPKDERKTMLFLSDDMRIPSGIGTMSREIEREPVIDTIGFN